MPDVAYEIRHIRFEERAEWEPLWHAYQAFYKVVISDETTTVTWARLHDPAEPMGVLGAYVGGRLCGIVHYLFHRSCWTIETTATCRTCSSPKAHAISDSGVR